MDIMIDYYIYIIRDFDTITSKRASGYAYICMYLSLSLYIYIYIFRLKYFFYIQENIILINLKKSVAWNRLKIIIMMDHLAEEYLSYIALLTLLILHNVLLQSAE